VAARSRPPCPPLTAAHSAAHSLLLALSTTMCWPLLWGRLGGSRCFSTNRLLAPTHTFPYFQQRLFYLYLPSRALGRELCATYITGRTEGCL